MDCSRSSSRAALATRFFIKRQPSVAFIVIAWAEYVIHRVLENVNAPGVDGKVANRREQVNFPVYSDLLDDLAAFVDIVHEIVGHNDGERLADEFSRFGGLPDTDTGSLALLPAGHFRMRVGMYCHDGCQVLSGQACVFQQTVDFVAFDF